VISRPYKSSARTKTPRKSKPPAQGGRRARSLESVRSGSQLERVLALIREHPGIRPSELNRLLKRDESDGLRAALVKRGLIRKRKDGQAVRYYVV